MNIHKVYLLTGSNLGDKEQYLANARKELDKYVGRLITRSFLYISEPWGFDSHNTFLNQVLVYETTLTPHEILEIIKQIEKENGRIRLTSGYSSRNLDIDILFYDNLVLNSSDLTIPHARLHKRKFTLLPLTEISPDLIHPVIKASIKEILDNCDDKGVVTKL